MYHYRRRLTREIAFGSIALGGYQPIRVESMTNTHTLDTNATVAQCRRLCEAGCEIIRMTVPTEKDAENLRAIRDQLRKDGIDTPLVADIHFSARAAMKAVEFVDNIRINPGNYANSQKFSQAGYTEEEYHRELDHVRKEFAPLVEKARSLGVSMRIGTNHGSLSDRIVSRYGNSPDGMVEAALEFARICEDMDYHDLLFSMKSSNVRVMIQAYRLLVQKADTSLRFAYPLHLGVTEAGDGDEGRVKSAMGIGALLEDGLGDTIRVSLTEDPVNEIPAGFAIVRKYNEFHQIRGDQGAVPLRHIVESRIPGSGTTFPDDAILPFDPCSYQRRVSQELHLSKELAVGGQALPLVETTLRASLLDRETAVAEALLRLAPGRPADAIRSELLMVSVQTPEELLALDHFLADLGPAAARVAASTTDQTLFAVLLNKVARVRFDIVEGEKLEADFFALFDQPQCPVVELCFRHESAGNGVPGTVLAHLAEKLRNKGMDRLLLSICSSRALFAYRRLVQHCNARGLVNPLVIRYNVAEGSDRLDAIVDTAIQTGTLFCDGIGDIIALQTPLAPADEIDLAFNILQGARIRMSKTEFISCPGCGRTYFELEAAAGAIKRRMVHLKGLKIGIMGCIVNGPGEMADADFGYVGAGKNRISLYVGRDCVAENIDEELAVERLVMLIKEHGRWVDPEPEVR